MKPDNRLLISAPILIILILSSLCFASMTVSIETDETNYKLGDNVTFTAQVVIVNESGCCNLDNTTLHISDGSSQTCSLATEQANYDSGYGNCNLTMIVVETHPIDCDTYGGDNTYNYTICWPIPSNWEADQYSATMTVSACGNDTNGSTNFDVTTTTTIPTTTTTIKKKGGGGGGGGGGFSGVPLRKETCYDGLMNCHDGACEEDVDCGGPCEPCPSCTDSIQNQGEEGIDCGGPCKPCVTETTTTIKSKASTTTTPTTIATTTITPITTSTIRAKAIITTTIAAASTIPLGVTELMIGLLALILIITAVMIQRGKI